MKRTVLSFLVVAVLLTVPQASAQWLTNGTNIYYNGGKVGIGTSTPFVALHVLDPVNQGVGFFQNPNGLVALGVDASGGYLQADAIDFSFFAGANRVLFGESSNGYVGMGTVTPTSQLDVRTAAYTAIRGQSSLPGGTAVEAIASGVSSTSWAFFAYSPTGTASVSQGRIGVRAVASNNAADSIALDAASGGALGLAGRFTGNVTVTGTLAKGAGSFKIDHPLDPENKYLYHSFVESPDMMNIYNGSVVLDAEGVAVVIMPKWFEALNRDFQYQLTCVGGYAPVYVASKMAGNQFQIAGGKGGLEVSWQVTGIRHDKFAEKNRIPLEEDKSAEDRGYYLHPEAFDQSSQRSLPSMHQESRGESRKMEQ